MKKYLKHTLKGFIFSLLCTIFTLILLPLGIVALYHILPFETGYESPPSEKAAIPDKIQVYRTSLGLVEHIPFEDYVKGVVSGEMPSSFEEEALKAQAVAARTYSLSKVMRSGDSGFPAAHPLAPLCDSTHCQVYRDVKELSGIKSAEWMAVGWPKIVAAVDNTRGQLMYYSGALAEQALFHSSSGGTTENSEDVFASAVPYLRSVESPYEAEATHQNEQTILSISTFENKIKGSFPRNDFGNITKDNIKVKTRSAGGRVEEIQIGNCTLTGRNVRESLGLSSAKFTIQLGASSSGDVITITTSGFGHGVGMSQYGANGMAKEGYDYKEILAHYYSGITVY